MTNPKVTVLMSVYNGKKYLGEAIDSILNQTFKDFEFLIINDGSIDGTTEILQGYHDPRIKIINNEKNIGLTKSLNKGLKSAKGEYIARMDVDDISLPERLGEQLAIIENSDQVGMVASWIKITDENGKFVENWQVDRENNSPEEIYYTLFFRNCIAHSSVLFKKDIVLKIGGYNESFRKAQDYELWTRLSKLTKIIKARKELVIRRVYDMNTSFEVINQHRVNEKRIFLKNINNLLPKNFNLDTLLGIKYDNSTLRIEKNNIFNVLNKLNKINKEIIKTSPFFLEKAKLKKWGKNKRNRILKNSSLIQWFDTSESKKFILNLFRNMIRSQKSKREAVFICAQSIFKVFLLSPSLGIFSFLSLFYYSTLKTLKLIIRLSIFITRNIPEYIYFFFSFKQKCSRLKTSKDQKNILCIVPFLDVGGAERVILNIAKGTNRKKYSFHIITTKPANDSWHDKFQSYFQNIVIPLKIGVSQLICNKYFYRLIKNLKIDMVLISHSIVGYKYLPELRSKFPNTKIIDILHSEVSGGAMSEFEWVTTYFDRRICISNHLKKYMVEKYRNAGLEDRYIKKLRVIYNGIDVVNKYSPNVHMKGKFKSQYGIPDDTKIISFIGRFVEAKNSLLFVDIARNIISRNHNYKLKFIMVGDGPEFYEVKNVITKYGIKDYFILTGMIDSIAEFLADTYVLLVVSKREGIPFIILESMAMKVPVISTNIGAVHEVVKNGINGYLIDPESNVVEEFTSKILDLLSDNKSYKTLAEKSGETIDPEYSIRTMAAKYNSIFDELIGEDYD